MSESASGHDVVVVEEELDVGVSTVSLTEQLQVVAGVVQPVLVPLSVKVLVVHVPVLQSVNTGQQGSVNTLMSRYHCP